MLNSILNEGTITSVSYFDVLICIAVALLLGGGNKFYS